MNGITRETFESADEKTRLSILFDGQKGTHDNVKTILQMMQKHPLNCEERFIKLENRKLLDTAVATSLGFVGGFTAVITKLKFWG